MSIAARQHHRPGVQSPQIRDQEFEQRGLVAFVTREPERFAVAGKPGWIVSFENHRADINAGLAEPANGAEPRGYLGQDYCRGFSCMLFARHFMQGASWASLVD